MYRLFTTFCSSVVVFSLGVVTAHAQNSDPEWPCIQRLVPEIVTGVMWPQAIDEELIGTWREDEDIASMAHNLSDLDELTDVEREMIAEFNASLDDDARSNSLDSLADGIVALSNKRRTQYIKGIKRYTRQQISIAEQIETTLNELAALGDTSGTTTSDRRTEVEQTLHWHQRVFDQREHAMQALCERPVELEEKLSEVLRELAQYLP